MRGSTTEKEPIHLERKTRLAKKTRGSHEQRRAATYNKVMSAGISILYESGYQATTTTSIAQEAGMSRGALLHQFPTKTDLIVGIAEYLVTQYDEARQCISEQTTSSLEEFKQLSDLLWDQSKHKNIIALIEIRLASRSDENLASCLDKHVNVSVRKHYEEACQLAKKAGIKDENAIRTLTTLTSASIWGLAIFRLEPSYKEEVDKAYALMKDRRNKVIDKLLESAA